MNPFMRLISKLGVSHIVAALLSGFVYHRSLDKQHSFELGPESLILKYAVEIIFVPFRIANAIGSTLVGGPLSLSDRPLAELTISYSIVFTACFMAIHYSYKRNAKSIPGIEHK